MTRGRLSGGFSFIRSLVLILLTKDFFTFREGSMANHVGVNEELEQLVFVFGQLVEDVQHDLLEDRAQAAGPGAAMDREGGEISKSRGGEAERGAVEPEQLGVLFDQRVAGLLKHPDQVSFV